MMKKFVLYFLLPLILLAGPAAAVGFTIRSLDSASPLVDADTFQLQRNDTGPYFKITAAQIKTYVLNGLGITDLDGVDINTPSTGQVLTFDGSDWVNDDAATGSGDVTGQASSVDSEVALFSGTGGKTIKRASASGWAKLTSGVLSAITPASGVETFVTTPTSANLRSALTDESGSGAAVFATSPALTTPTVATTINPSSNDGAALGSGTVSWSDLFLASGGVLNWNNGDITLTHSSDNLALAGGEFNHSLSTATVSAPVAIDDVAMLGQDTVTWTPATNPDTTGVFVTNRMRKTIVDVGTASITGSGLSHPIGGYDYLLMQGNTNTLDYAFVTESKFSKTGTGILNNLIFFKPALGPITGTINNPTLFDCDMDPSSFSGNKYCLDNPTQTAWRIRNAGPFINGTGQQLAGAGSLNSGRYRGPMGANDIAGLGATPVALTAGQMYCTKIMIEAADTLDTMITNVTTDSGGDLRYCLYADGNGVPAGLLEDGGALVVSSTGIKSDTFNTAVQAGQMWACVAVQGSGLTLAFDIVTNYHEIYGMDASMTAGQAAALATGVTGSCPNPSGAAVVASSTLTPKIGLK